MTRIVYITGGFAPWVIGQNIDKLCRHANETLERPWPETPKIDTWDGQASDRIVSILIDWWRNPT